MSDTTEQFEKRIAKLEAAYAALSLSDRYMIAKNVQIQDGRSFLFGGTNGTRFGTSADQKISFYGASPVAQHSGISAPAGGSTVDSQARSAVTSLINALHNLGLIA